MPQNRKSFSAILLGHKERGVKVETQANAFGCCPRTMRLAHQGAWDERFSDLQTALSVLPPAMAKDIIEELLADAPFTAVHMECDAGKAVSKISQAVAVAREANDVLCCVNDAESDGFWTSEETAAAHAQLTELETETRRLRKAISQRSSRRAKRTA